MFTLEVTDLRKVYGDVVALSGITFGMSEGKAMGFVGPNGAGKTTTLRILLGLARPTSGTITMLGVDNGGADPKVRRQVGYLPDAPEFPAWMTAAEFLAFAGGLFGISGRVLDERVSNLLEMSGLAGVRQRIGGYSRGMKQRLGIAQALINAPRLLLLDEPTSALDPLGRRDVLAMIDALRGYSTILFSTHLLSDVEKVCDAATVVIGGRVAATGSIADLRSGFARVTTVAVDVEDGHDVLRRCLEAEPWCRAVDTAPEGHFNLTVTDLTDAGLRICQIAASQRLVLTQYAPQEATLEDIFVDLTNRRVA
jgi:ABC-2 type transport system ATP-binding protein